jgi:phosphoribosylamine-glycine ligase
MLRHGIPTARHASFTDAAAAHAHVRSHGAPNRRSTQHVVRWWVRGSA